MKLQIIKYFLLFALLFTNIKIYAYDFEVDGFCYNITSSVSPYTVAVTYKQSDSYYDEIGDPNYYSGSVSIPEKVTYNGITYTVTSMLSTFNNSKYVTSVYIPSTIHRISCDEDFMNLCFEECKSLKSINVDENNPYYCDIDGVLFSKDKTTLIAYPEAKSSDYVVPNTTVLIEKYAFYECAGLRSITIPSSVVVIGDCAFKECIGLTNVSLSQGLKIIGEGAFEDCENLSTIVIPDGVTEIGDCAFSCCGLESITIPGSITKLGFDEGFVFSECEKLSSVNIKEGLTDLGRYTFEDCSRLKNIKLPQSLKYINYSFSSSGLMSINLPKNVEEVELGVCKNLTEITVDIDNQEYCSINGVLFSKDREELCQYPAGRLTEEYRVPMGTLHIEPESFDECLNLKSIILPNSLESVGDNAFSWCENITSVRVQAIIPPEMSHSSFERISANAVLFVPFGTKDAYEITEWGDDFSSIIETDEFGYEKNNLEAEEHLAVFGKSNLLNISLKNEIEITGIQCDVFLPEGIDISLIENEYNIELSSRASSSHMVMSSLQSDGSVRILAYSAKSTAFEGNSGDLLKIAYHTSSTFTNGNILVKNIVMTSPSGKEYEGEELLIPISAVLLGDTNKDYKVNVTDVVNIANYTLGIHSSSFVFDAADVTSDGNINVSDIVGTTNIILYRTSVLSEDGGLKEVSVKAVNTDDRLFIDDFTIVPGGTRKIAINLTNAIPYSALQFDLKLPAGLSVYAEEDEYVFELSERKHRSHIIMSALQEDESIRVLAYSSSSKDFIGNSGAVIYLTIVADSSFIGTQSVKLENIILTTNSTQEYNPISCIATVMSSSSGIENMEVDSQIPIEYFNLQGVKVDKPKKGVYIRRKGTKTSKIIVY